jgi:hypothetical protein
MDHWETFFREKSSRRAKVNGWPVAVGWSFIATAFLALVTGLVVVRNLLI